jgi:hypothetical protein
LGGRRPLLPSGNTHLRLIFDQNAAIAPFHRVLTKRLHGMAIMPNLIGAILSPPGFFLAPLSGVFLQVISFQARPPASPTTPSTHGNADRQE